MKRISLLLLFCYLCTYCSDNELNDFKQESNKTQLKNVSIESKGVIYPLHSNSRGFPEEWENLEQITLSSGKPVSVPWNPMVVTTDIPTDVRMDIKKSDGWKILAHTINAGADFGCNYIFFYNQYTGMMKVFYYLEDVVMQTSGIWKIYIDRPQNLLAFTSDLADAIDSNRKRQEIYCTNINYDENKPFTRGWNCFEFELAYDPNFTEGYLTVDPICTVTAKINLTGTYQLKSEGTIITGTKKPSNSVIEGKAKAKGKDAYDWVSKQVKEGKISKTYLQLSANDILSKGISGLVKGGVDMLFSSFKSIFGKKTIQKTYKLSFTTNGNATFEGTINQNYGGGLTPVTINISKNVIGTLGVWNLQQQPITYFSTIARLLRSNDYIGYIYYLFPSPKTTYQTTYNPELRNMNPSFTAQMFRRRNYGNDLSGFNIGNLGISYGIGCSSENYSPIFNDLYKADFNFKFKVHFKDHPYNVNNPDYNHVPSVLFAPRGKTDQNDGLRIKSDHVFKVRMTMVINNGTDTVTSTKTFIPKFEWDPKDYETNKAEYPDDYLIINLQP